MKLNLGSADRHFDGYVSVDAFRPDNAPPDFQLVDLAGPWPWETGSIEAVKAFDIAEHIGDCSHFSQYPCERCFSNRAGTTCHWMQARRHPLGRIHFMNELHRVLAHGGIAEIEVPDALTGAGFYQDPTHCQPWTRNSFQYFQWKSFAHTRLAKAYGITAEFLINSMELDIYQDVYDKVGKIKATLAAVK